MSKFNSYDICKNCWECFGNHRHIDGACPTFYEDKKFELWEKANPLDAQVSQVCGGCFEIENLRRIVLNFLSNRIFYYSRQQNANPNLPRVHARKKEIEYLLKEINNIFIETNKKLLGEPENNVMSRKSG